MRPSMNSSRGYHFVLTAALCSLVLGIGTSCVKHVSSLPSGPITISGEVNDATGLPLPNGKLRLFREHEYLETTTNAGGAYSFPNLAASSYLLLPRLMQCHFLPPDADLDRLTGSTTQYFGGWGPGCG